MPAFRPAEGNSMKLYDALAEWWPLMSPPADYAEEAEGLARLLHDGRSDGRPRVLELGSGGGHLASHLRGRFDLTLVDRAPRMLALSRALNPDCRHLEGDMRTLRLGETFDAVLIFDAVSHLTSVTDLAAALATARAHLCVDGVAVFCPDWTCERFRPGTTHGGTDGPERGMRYVAWTHPEVVGTVYRTDLVYLLRSGQGSEVRIEHDSVKLGLFSRDVWIATLRGAGFGEARIVTQAERDVFVARAA
jgi:SAM-dependent methyltransferase